MRKLIVLSFISLDNVMQAPGGPDEDTSGGFRFGGWTYPYFDDFLGKVMTEQMGGQFSLLLGRKTYDIFASYWPRIKSGNFFADKLNNAEKYVVSRTLTRAEWKNSTLVNGKVLGENVVVDVSMEIEKLKKQAGPDMHVHGSGNLIQTLLKHDLVDELWLKIFPVTLGAGKRLFAEGTIPAAFRMTKGEILKNGVIIANYERAGEVKTGTLG